MKQDDLSGVQSCSPVICSADDALVIKANTTHKFFMTFEYSQTRSAVDIPQSVTHTSTHATHTIPSSRGLT